MQVWVSGRKIMCMRAGSPGSLQLDGLEASPMVQQMGTVTASPVFSLMVCLDSRAVNAPFDGATVTKSDGIRWISRDSSKPGQAFTSSLSSNL